MTHHEGPTPGAGCGFTARRTLAWGAGAATLYVLTVVMALQGSLVPVRILYDGLAPLLPYRWTHPPLELAKDNQPPEPGGATLPLTTGTPPGSVTTGDGQASVIFDENTVASVRGESVVQVTIVPLDPATVAVPPPGTRFDGNAYRIDARYAPSGTPVRLRAPATVVLRYATGATKIVHAAGAGWSALQTLTYPGSLQLVVAKSETLGIFASVAPQTLPYTHRSWWWIYAVAAIPVIIALLIGYLPRMLTRLRSRPG